MKFETGRKYEVRFVTDADARPVATIRNRTAKQVVIELNGDVRRCKIHITEDGGEFCYPLGIYSMAPVCRAIRAID